MLRSLAVVLVLGLVVFQVALAWQEVDDEEENDREFERPEQALFEDMNMDKKALSGSRRFSIVGKPTKQSSTLELYTPNRAVDGSISTSLRKCSITMKGAKNPWWRVDLGGLHCISKVTILNRGDCCSDRLANAVVRAGISSTPTDNQACGSPVTAAQAQPLGGTIENECRTPLRARYVSVDIPGLATLQLCEVMVEERPLSQCPGSTRFSIVGKPTKQSSTLQFYTPNRAVDRSISCSITMKGAKNPWWRVDLGGLHCISKVTILNRGDCCSDRLANAVVRAGISSTPTDNQACGSPVTAAQAQPLGGTIENECRTPLKARYVSVDIPGLATLQLCEVRVEERPLSQCPVILAVNPTTFSIVNMPTTQSSTLGGYTSGKAVDGSSSSSMHPGQTFSHTVPTKLSIVNMPTEQSSTLDSYSSDKAVDGSSSASLYPGQKCSHTTVGASNPWWRVDLRGEHCISKVTILNREDCCSDRLANAIVRAGTSSTPTENQACGSPVTAAQAQPLGGTIENECRTPLRARYVSVDIPGSATLQLCEVTVEEIPLDQCPVPTKLSIVNMPTEQSSTLDSYSSDKAVDGSSSASLYPGQKCSHTTVGASNPWWRVDLGGEHCISKVTLLNRGDCCSDRLTNAVVRAGTSPTPTDNQACGSAVTAAQAQPLGGTIEIACGTTLKARYISVDIPGSATLQLCEVTVEEMLPGMC